MQTLEHITINGETCVNHIRSLKESYVPEEDERHRNCLGNNHSCPDYRPIRIYEVPINDVRFG